MAGSSPMLVSPDTGAHAMVIVFGVLELEKVTEYDVRCDTAASRACRITANVVLYALVTC